VIFFYHLSPFFFHQIEDLLTRLREAWPNLVGSNRRFWGYEWSKHGVCAYPRFDPHEYFLRAIESWDSYNLTEVLLSSGITPQTVTSYALASVVRAIETRIGFTPPTCL